MITHHKFWFPLDYILSYSLSSFGSNCVNIDFAFSVSRSGDSRGFGFLSLERDEDADAAIRALDQTEWDGRVILVEKSKTP